ncbi:Protein-L-isoaspartate O-methyltransferase [Paraliobacillus sp. PM-2]|uniref:O-methyltransferase n=1 Tax=Paraliobacillus sp. PM-2 TaxID=1462524 RepID=UPI00061C707B|nr:O-methyltransferase [Paraliobacillus sp. PM-2]CQR46925.1 Protein-L-isoaspartate O-methyltransferase [Paraliobacillus sp. PM-2]
MNEEYLEDLLEASPEWIKELEDYAQRNHVPIMEPLGIDFLMQIIRMKQPKRILEIGTAIGYSALRMLQAFPQTSIITIERDEDRYQQALNNIAKYDKEGKINIIFSDALECVETIRNKAPFDLLFVDAAKGQYQRFFELYSPMLSDNGVIISDNVLFKGLVASKENTVEKRKNKLVNKIKSYNQWLANHPDYHTSIIPIGDGVAITTKSEKE